jgi:hypothetical protein
MFSRIEWKTDEFCEAWIAGDPALTTTVLR